MLCFKFYLNRTINEKFYLWRIKGVILGVLELQKLAQLENMLRTLCTLFVQGDVKFYIKSGGLKLLQLSLGTCIHDSHIKLLEILQKHKNYKWKILSRIYSITFLFNEILRLNEIHNLRLATFIFKKQQFIENCQYLIWFLDFSQYDSSPS